MRSFSSLVVFLCLFTFSILGFGAKPPAAKKGAVVKAEAEHETTETTKPTVLKNEVDLDRPIDTSVLKTGEFFLKIIEVDGRKVKRAYFKDGATGKEYRIRACDEGTDESKKCIAEIGKCKAGDKCEIRAEISGDSIIAKSLKVLPEEKVTKTNNKFRLVGEEELAKLLGDRAFAKKCGEAYEAPNKVVWCDAAKKTNGILEYMNYSTAVEYCKKMGAELPKIGRAHV